MPGRTYRVHLPPDATPPCPALLVYHALLMTGAGMAQLTGLDSVANWLGIVVVYPEAADGHWHTTAQERVDGQDVAQTREILAQLAPLIDPARVYAAGFSSGGMCVHMLGCDMGDRLAGIISVAGTLDKSQDTARAPALPVLMIHGRRDALVPYVESGWFPFRGVDETAALWTARGGTVTIVPHDGGHSWPQDATTRIADWLLPRLHGGGDAHGVG